MGGHLTLARVDNPEIPQVPQPITQFGYTLHRRALLQRPNLAARIGAIAAEWTQIEVQLTRLAADATGRHSYNAETGVGGLTPNVYVQVAVDQAETIRTRLKVLDGIFTIVLKRTAFLDEWELIKAALLKRSKERNRIVHGDWAVSDIYPKCLVKVSAPEDGGASLYTEKDFDETLDRIVTLRDDCLAFGDRIRADVLSGGIQSRPEGPNVG